MLELTLTLPTILGLVMSAVPVGYEGVYVEVADKVDAAPIATVSTVGSSTRHILFATATYRAIATRAAFYVNNYTVNHI